MRHCEDAFKVYEKNMAFFLPRFLWYENKNDPLYQCCRSSLVSIRIRIQHFRSMRIRIQGFAEQKLKNFTAESHIFCDQKLHYIYARSPWRTSKLQKSPQPSKKNIQYFIQSNFPFFYFYGSLMLSWIRLRIPNADPDPADHNQCGTKPIWIRTWIHNTAVYSKWIRQW